MTLGTHIKIKQNCPDQNFRHNLTSLLLFVKYACFSRWSMVLRMVFKIFETLPLLEHQCHQFITQQNRLAKGKNFSDAVICKISNSGM